MPRRNQTVRPESDTLVTDPEQQESPHTNGDAQQKEKEAKDVRFCRLAIKRVPAAIKRIRHVANLANRNQYAYTEAHAAKIIDALETELRALKNAFTGTKAPVESWSL